jgi:hypothetical protein
VFLVVVEKVGQKERFFFLYFKEGFFLIFFSLNPLVISVEQFPKFCCRKAAPFAFKEKKKCVCDILLETSLLFDKRGLCFFRRVVD